MSERGRTKWSPYCSPDSAAAAAGMVSSSVFTVAVALSTATHKRTNVDRLKTTVYIYY